MKNLLTSALTSLNVAIETRCSKALHDASYYLEQYKASKFDESKRDRIPKGQEGGGRWTNGNATTGAAWDADKGKWVNEKGTPISAKLQKRIAENGKISKNLIGVKINPSEDPNEVNFAVGYPYNPETGHVGKKVYVQNHNHKVKRHKAKFGALKMFDKARKEIEKHALTDAMNGKPAAAIAYLMNLTAIRVGSGKTNRPLTDPPHYGCCDLLVKHVQVRGKAVHLKFRAKHGKMYDSTIIDEGLAKIMNAFLQDKKGNNKKSNARLFEVTSDTVNTYLKEKGKNKKLHAHQYRHWKATEMASKLVRLHGKPIDAKDARRIKESICNTVSELLVNEPEESYQTYISPIVWQVWGEEERPAAPLLSKKSATTHTVRQYEGTRATANFDALVEETIFPDFEDEIEPDLDLLEDPEADDQD